MNDELDKVFKKTEFDSLYKNVKELYDKAISLGIDNNISIDGIGKGYLLDYFNCLKCSDESFDFLKKFETVLRNSFLLYDIKKFNDYLDAALSNDNDISNNIDNYVSIIMRYINGIINTEGSKDNFDKDTYQEFFDLVYSVLKLGALYDSQANYDNLLMQINNNGEISSIINEKIRSEVNKLKDLNDVADENLSKVITSYLLSMNLSDNNYIVNKDLLKSLSSFNISFMKELETKLKTESDKLSRLNDKEAKKHSIYMDKTEERINLEEKISSTKSLISDRIIAFILALSMTTFFGIVGLKASKDIKDKYADLVNSEQNKDDSLFTCLNFVIVSLMALPVVLYSGYFTKRLTELREELNKVDSDKMAIVEELEKIMEEMKDSVSSNYQLAMQLEKISIEMTALKESMYLEYDQLSFDASEEIIEDARRQYTKMH